MPFLAHPAFPVIVVLAALSVARRRRQSQTGIIEMKDGVFLADLDWRGSPA